jgi:hypothetical protein
MPADLNGCRGLGVVGSQQMDFDRDRSRQRAQRRRRTSAQGRFLTAPLSSSAATEALRGLIDVIAMTPAEGSLRIELKGNLAAMLGATEQSKRAPETEALSLQVSMVAGAGFEPATFGL